MTRGETGGVGGRIRVGLVAALVLAAAAGAGRAEPAALGRLRALRADLRVAPTPLDEALARRVQQDALEAFSELAFSGEDVGGRPVARVAGDAAMQVASAFAHRHARFAEARAIAAAVRDLYRQSDDPRAAAHAEALLRKLKVLEARARPDGDERVGEPSPPASGGSVTRAAWLGVVLVLGLAGVALARRRVPPDLEVADARLQAEAGRALKMGLALLQRGRTAQAVKYLEKVAELESTLRDRGRYFLALVRLERGDLEGMNQALTQLDFAAIERAEAYDLGEALERRGQLDEACSVFERLYLTDVQFRDVETRLNALRKRVEQFSGDEVANLISRRILDSRFRSVRAIGSGGMGFVYEALDEGRGGQRVAVKVLSPFYANTHEAYTRFVREAQGLAALEHPNLVQVFDVFQQNLPYYSMEFVESEDLKVILEREGRLEEPAAVRILEAVCAGLGHAHDHGVTHRDVKPSNVLVLTDGAVKVIDFGVAKFDDETEMTITGQVLGTPLYMSPEQVKGVEVDHRSDIYSVGVLAYTLLAGVPPFETALERGYEDAPPLPEGVCSPPVARAVARALARDVEARYQHLEDLRADLRSA